MSRPLVKTHRWLAVLLAALLGACSSGQDLSLAEQDVAHFREMMAAQQFDQIYAGAADEFKKTTTRENFTRLLAAVDRKLGAVKTADKNGWNVNFNTSGTSVTLRYKTQFERGSGDEAFFYRITGGKALLAGYNINSNELITN
jgi:hypothetical protein